MATRSSRAVSKKVMAYDRGQNMYANGIAEQNAENMERMHADEIGCEVRVIPTDIFGRILDKAKVSFNGGAEATVEDGGNITVVGRLSNLPFKVTCEGYEDFEGSVSMVKGNMLLHPTMGYAPAAAPAPSPETPSAGGVIVPPVDGGESDTEL